MTKSTRKLPRSTRKLPSLALEAWLNEPRLQAVLAVLNRGGETRVVGGAIRNALLKMPVREVDLATTLVPQDVMQLARGAGFGVHPTGIDHGTVTVVNHAVAFEVTTLRRDLETDGRHATVIFTHNFAQDASRRDFTMNALYCSRQGEITDYTDGYGDLLKHKVKFVGKPAERIAEDYLRILRFFRCHAAFGKGIPDKAGIDASRRLRTGLQNLSAERVRQEILKLLVAPRAVETLQVMAKTGILKIILPHTDDWRLLKRLPRDAILRLFALADDSAGLKERFKLSNAEAERIAALTSAPRPTPKLTEKDRRAMLYRSGPAMWRDAVDLAHASSRAGLKNRSWLALRELPSSWTIPTLPISGQDLLKIGYPSGPYIGLALGRAEDYWVAKDFVADRDQLLRYIKETA